MSLPYFIYSFWQSDSYLYSQNNHSNSEEAQIERAKKEAIDAADKSKEAAASKAGGYYDSAKNAATQGYDDAVKKAEAAYNDVRSRANSSSQDIKAEAESAYAKALGSAASLSGDVKNSLDKKYAQARKDQGLDKGKSWWSWLTGK